MAGAILLVDDDDDDLLALEATLAPLGRPLVRASSGEEALRLLLRDDFAAIVMDVLLPGISGIEAAALIRSRERSRDIPILFLSGLDEDGLRAVSKERPRAEYLFKPVSPDVLLEKLRECLERSSSKTRPPPSEGASNRAA